eukprot:365800-Chlamydomonas_euryale.AAC.19
MAGHKHVLPTCPSQQLFTRLGQFWRPQLPVGPRRGRAQSAGADVQQASSVAALELPVVWFSSVNARATSRATRPTSETRDPSAPQSAQQQSGNHPHFNQHIRKAAQAG